MPYQPATLQALEHACVASVTPSDLPEIAALHARAFGPGRFARAAYRVREGMPLCSAHCLIARLDGALAASLRFQPVTIGGVAGALLLGPLAVEPRLAGQGYGRKLVAVGLERAAVRGIALVVLVGDEPYYGRFGFKVVPARRITMPGPVDPARLLAAELVPGALEAYRGLVAADA